jgi:hypothetical protein
MRDVCVALPIVSPAGVWRNPGAIRRLCRPPPRRRATGLRPYRANPGSCV